MTTRLVLVLMVVGLVAAACTSGKGSSAPSHPGTPATRPAGPPVTNAAGAALSLSYDEAAATTVDAHVTAPKGATQMQIGIDPTFATPQWQAVTDDVKLDVADTGYVMVFTRFRTGNDAQPSEPIVAGVQVDPTWTAATASASGNHRVSTGGLVEPDVLDLRIETGRVVTGGQVRYSFASPPQGDQIVAGDGQLHVVMRNGQTYGTQVAANSDYIKLPDSVIGRPIDTQKLDRLSGYKISSTDDPAFSGGKAPARISRVTSPIGLAKIDSNNVSPVAHDVFLGLPGPLKSGATYSIAFPDGVADTYSFTFDGHLSRSPAIHANQLGYRPNDILKVAYLSTYDGVNAYRYADGTPFDVVDARTGSVVFSGKSKKRSVPADGEFGKGTNLTGAEVHALDFTQLNTAGKYRICIPSIGCSYDFAISDTDTWQRAMVDVARSVYQQRSGTALTEPYTAVVRPRVFSPDDGVKATQSTLSLMASSNGLNDSETNVNADIAKGDTGKVVDGAWGGHFDAGDWDRRIQHLWYLREAIQLIDLYPGQFASLDLGIPESNNAIPDLIDEGLWDLDLYKRLQQPDGGVRGGIEADDSSTDNQSSWTQTQHLYVYAADPWSTYIYAGVAADAARAIRKYDPARADAYQQSALAAMTWAEAQKVPSDYADDIGKQRAVAAASLYRLTGDAHWQDVFISASGFANGPIDLLSCDAHQLCDAGFTYAQTDQPTVNAAVKANVLESFTRNANQLVTLQGTTLFGWTLEHPAVPLIFGLGPATPKVEGLLRAYVLTKDPKYCSAALSSASFSMGANPLDTAFMTGIGQRNVRNPLVVDSITGGLPYWPGIPVFGMHNFNRPSDSWIPQYFLRPAGTKPDPAALPFLRDWFDLPNVAPMNEFTVYQSQAPSLFAYGNLAALSC